MSLRCVFVVCLNTNSLLFYNLFHTVEARWLKKHPENSSFTLPRNEELVQSLLNELGILDSSTFQYSRDSCKKNFQAPLFWVPYRDSPSHYWPILIVECKNRLLCGVPILDNIHPFEDVPSLTASRCTDIAVILELLLSLVHYAELPAPKLEAELRNRILHHLPFGRPINHSQQRGCLQATPSKASWLKSKPKIEIKVIEEVKLSASKEAIYCELHGTAIFNSERDANCTGVKLLLHFQRLKDFPDVLYHSCVATESEKDAHNFTIKYMPDKTFTLLHYSFKLRDVPVEARLKVSNVDEKKRTVIIRLHLCSEFLKLLRLNRLEVRMPLPEGNRVNRVTSVNANAVGTVSLLNNRTQLAWSIISQSSTNSANVKLKEELSLNAEIEMENQNISLQNTYLTVLFSAIGSTLSDLKFTLHQSGDFKLSQSFNFKSGIHYRSWNGEADEII